MGFKSMETFEAVMKGFPLEAEERCLSRAVSSLHPSVSKSRLVVARRTCPCRHHTRPHSLSRAAPSAQPIRAAPVALAHLSSPRSCPRAIPANPGKSRAFRVYGVPRPRIRTARPAHSSELVRSLGSSCPAHRPASVCPTRIRSRSRIRQPAIRPARPFGHHPTRPALFFMCLFPGSLRLRSDSKSNHSGTHFVQFFILYASVYVFSHSLLIFVSFNIIVSFLSWIFFFL
ncbi:hypothetical protein QJS10_CPA03g01332 [Acorus calamus]|uniref:Uncharacterized protein n=1 Tax=Acorus calamus TaxID=4465 RepID=A0AAV9F374_ACOCL|nr:hypothetical protein QJS10_CPA03g01332 [Acorus calamus]